MFTMARDGMLPASGVLRRVDARRGTPVPALLASLGICLVLLAFGVAFGDAFAVLVGATALVPYLIYLLTVGGYLAQRRRLRPGGFELGRAALPVAALALVWLLAVVGVLALPEAFRAADYVVLGALALAGLWYVAVLRRRLATGEAALTADPEEVVRG